MRHLHYLHLDVFTTRPFEGNQLAVFPEASGVDPRTMQTIAREMNFSESTFVLPRERDDTDVRMRIFTPGRELPMAGHPVIGSTVALAHTGAIPRGQRRFVFGLGVGPLPVDLEWEGEMPSFVWMTQLRPTFGPAVHDVAGVAAVIGLAEADLRAVGTPVQAVSCGNPFVMVPLPSKEAVDRAAINEAATPGLRLPDGTPHAYFMFALDPADESLVYSRMFAPDVGVSEDPATGSATGPLGCYLLKHRLVSAERARSMTNIQGVKMGRPSRLHFAITGTPDDITEVKVGGAAVVVGEGTLFI
jgi:trans-2,3-dihydro-3-hydroxyanthranilate isomerase